MTLYQHLSVYGSKGLPARWWSRGPISSSSGSRVKAALHMCAVGSLDKGPWLKQQLGTLVLLCSIVSWLCSEIPHCDPYRVRNGPGTPPQSVEDRGQREGPEALTQGLCGKAVQSGVGYIVGQRVPRKYIPSLNKRAAEEEAMGTP